MTPEEIVATKLLGAEVDEHGFSRLYFNPDDWNDIRRMEDALAEKGLFSQYYMELACATPAGGTYWDTRATAEQRVQAALKVIEEAGL